MQWFLAFKVPLWHAGGQEFEPPWLHSLKPFHRKGPQGAARLLFLLPTKRLRTKSRPRQGFVLRTPSPVSVFCALYRLLRGQPHHDGGDWATVSTGSFVLNRPGSRTKSAFNAPVAGSAFTRFSASCSRPQWRCAEVSAAGSSALVTAVINEQ